MALELKKTRESLSLSKQMKMISEHSAHVGKMEVNCENLQNQLDESVDLIKILSSEKEKNEAALKVWRTSSTVTFKTNYKTCPFLHL